MAKSNLAFIEGEFERGVTRRWAVKSKDGQWLLGEIKWFSPWRRYCFYPMNGVLFDADCLVELQVFLRERTDEQREDAKARRLAKGAQGRPPLPGGPARRALLDADGLQPRQPHDLGPGAPRPRVAAGALRRPPRPGSR